MKVFSALKIFSKLPVRGKDDAPALTSDVSQDIPQVAASVGVHSSGGLVLAQHGTTCKITFHSL